ncbi:MAG: TolC family protein, partial [Thermodesulfobacteriota bacterium]
QDTYVSPNESYDMELRTPDLDKCMEIAKKQNSSYITAQNLLKRKNLIFMQAKSDKLWDLSFDAKYYSTGYRSDLKETIHDEDYWETGLNLNIPFNIFGQSSYDNERDVLSAEIGLDNAKLFLQEAKEDLKTDVLNKVRNVIHAAKKVKLSQKSLELTEKTYSMDKIRLGQGRITTNELIDSQERLTLAEHERISSVINFMSQANDLDHYLGTLLQTYEIEFKSYRPKEAQRYLGDKTYLPGISQRELY